MNVQKIKILIVDDDSRMGNVLKDILKSAGYNVDWSPTGNDALKLLEDQTVDLILLDLVLPGIDGIAVLEKVQKKWPKIAVIMMSGYSTIQTAVKSIQLGAYDWLEKPLEKERVLLTVRNAVERMSLLQDRSVLLSQTEERYKMIGTSGAMKTIFQLIDRIAPVKSSVLITGESGTGKELVAHAIHNNSERKTSSFIKLNCAAMPETLIESELFGYVKGAFTGAHSTKKGKFQLAEGGTLFLDEIGDLSLSAQAKLLRSIETGEVEKVGTENTEQVDVRLITATNKCLQDMIDLGTFRSDLFHRINVIGICVPALKERKEDILPLINNYIECFSIENNLVPKRLTTDAETQLISYNWPGNVRELRNLCERLVVLIPEQNITNGHIAQLLSMPKLNMHSNTPSTYKLAKETFDKSFIRNSLLQNNWNVLKTAEIIGMKRSLLYRKIERYNLQRPLKVDTSS